MSHLPWIALNPSWSAAWGTLALVNAGLAQGKRRSGLAGYPASLALGPSAAQLLNALDRPDAAPN